MIAIGYILYLSLLYLVEIWYWYIHFVHKYNKSLTRPGQLYYYKLHLMSIIYIYILYIGKYFIIEY